jgi:hypothetical protein
MTKPTIISFIIGLLLGALIIAAFFETEKTKLILDIVQTLVITLATIFTAWWTSKTFAYPQKTEEAKELKKLLSSLNNAVNYYLTHKRLIDLNELTSQVVPTSNQEYTEFLKQEENRLRMNFDMNIFELKQAQESFITLEAWTSYLLLDLSFTKIESVKQDSGEKIRKDIMALQYRLRDEASFNIRVEWIKLKKYFGF